MSTPKTSISLSMAERSILRKAAEKFNLKYQTYLKLVGLAHARYTISRKKSEIAQLNELAIFGSLEEASAPARPFTLEIVDNDESPSGP